MLGNNTDELVFTPTLTPGTQIMPQTGKCTFSNVRTFQTKGSWWTCECQVGSLGSGHAVFFERTSFIPDDGTHLGPDNKMAINAYTLFIQEKGSW